MSDRAERWLFRAILAVTVALRVLDLDWVPGVNGDEAWYNVQAQALWAGHNVSWFTPTEVLQNPFFFGPVVALAWLPPSFLLVRVPAVAVGLLLIVLTHRLVPKMFGSDASHGRAATLLVAALPINLGYSRYAWAPCETTLASLVTFYFATQRRFVACAVAFVALVWVHATNVFTIVPLAGVALGAVAMEGWPRRRDLAHAIGAWLATLAVYRLVLLPAQAASSIQFLRRNLESLEGWRRFVVGYGRLLSGTTLYEYVVAPQTPRSLLVHDVTCFCVVLIVIVWGLWVTVRARDHAVLGLVLGTLLGAAAFYAVAGDSPLLPGHERYAMGLVMPALLSCIGLARRMPGTRWTAPALATLMLASFVTHYVVPLRTIGSRTHPTFHSTPGEPKAIAFAAILRDAGDADAVNIYAENWFLYWPLRYLGGPDARVAVQQLEIVQYRGESILDPTALRTLAAQNTYFVGFAGGPLERTLPSAVRDLPLDDLVIRDMAGEPILHVWRRRPGR